MRVILDRSMVLAPAPADEAKVRGLVVGNDMGQCAGHLCCEGIAVEVVTSW